MGNRRMEFINLQAQYIALKGKIDSGISEVLSDSDYILGEQVERFEHSMGNYVGVKHVIACSDGTAALQLIYMAYGIGKGDAVFCPDMTFIASIEPACLLGATPVFCDIDENTYNISPESLKRQIEAVREEKKLRPRAIVAVDFLGNPADFDELKEIAEENELLLIEDAAQGMGALYKGKKCGSLGDIAATSFFPSKPLGCYGDGGAVFTNDGRMVDVIKSLRVHGRGIDKYHNVRIGINSRLDTIQAAVLLVKLEVLEKEIEQRQTVADYYAEALREKYVIPYVAETNVSAYAQYVIKCREKKMREKIVSRLKMAGIPSILYYPVPMHLLPVFQNVNCYGLKYENAVEYSREHFGIPFSPYLTREEQEKVIGTLLEAI